MYKNPSFAPRSVSKRFVFFSLRLADPAAQTLIQFVPALRRSLRAVRLCRPFEVDSIVVLPSALHTIWDLPPSDTDISSRVRLLREHFVSAVPGATPAIWQDHFVPHYVRASDAPAYRDMIHSAPVSSGYVEVAEAWQFSSIHRARAA